MFVNSILSKNCRKTNNCNDINIVKYCIYGEDLQKIKDKKKKKRKIVSTCLQQFIFDENYL